MECELSTYYNDHFLVRAYPLNNEKREVVVYFTEMLENNKMTELKNLLEIERVLLNLISNAIKHTKEGDKIIVKVTEKERHMIISVSDNGVRIPEDKQLKIFDKFTQVNNLLERDSNSSGLGLSIVKYIVESHKGDLQSDF